LFVNEEVFHGRSEAGPGKGCLYIKKLDDVNLSVLEDLVKQSVEHTKATYKSS